MPCVAFERSVGAMGVCGRGGGAVADTFSVMFQVVVQRTLSVTTMANWNVPLAVGVPLRIPPAVTLIPGGSEPLPSAKLYGGVPPVALKVTLYGVPCVAFDKNDGAMVICGQGGGAVAATLTVMFQVV